MAEAAAGARLATSLQVSDAALAPLVRAVELRPGQVLQATVLAAAGDGRVLLGMLGGIVEAATALPLVAGQSYALQVTSLGNGIVLSLARMEGSAAARVPAQALLGLGGAELRQLLATLAAAGRSQAGLAGGVGLAGGLGLAGAGADGGAARVLRLLERLADGSLRGEDLLALHRGFGHEQEARLLRLPAATDQAAAAAAATAAELRGSVKSHALQLLQAVAAAESQGASAAEAASDAGRARLWAQQFVDGMNTAEADNARRADQGAPAWLPLPVPGGGALREARMFAAVADAGDDGAGGGEQRPFTVVLLLDFTRLGAVRVDVQVRGDEVGVTMQAVELGALEALRPALPELRAMLEAAGLRVRAIEARRAPGERLPVADLILPPVDAVDAAAIVDVHA